ncbi:carboxypeptidase regulatory-like domain-containing protein [Fibrella sp. USSR17]
MKSNPFFRLFFALLGLVLIFQNCQPTQELQPTDKPSRSARSSVSAGGYTVALVSTTGTNWHYSITNNQNENSGNLNTWNLSLGDCITEADVASIDGFDRLNGKFVKGQTEIAIATVAGKSWIQITGIPALPNGQSFDLSFTLAYAVPTVSVPLSATTSTIDTQGNSSVSGTFNFDIDGPGCPQITGTVYKATCSGAAVTPYANVTVTAAPGLLTAITGVDGSYTLAGISGLTTYTLSVTGTPDNVQSVSPATQTAVSTGVANFTAITGPCGNGCSMSQGFYFAKPNSPWTTVTLGGYTYTYNEARAIWSSSNAKGINDTKKAFLQAATIALSAGTISPTASVWTDYNTINTYLTNLGKKITAGDLGPTGSSASKKAATAAGNIGKWIQANHCDYSDAVPLYLP